MKISELTRPDFISGPNAAASSDFIINYDDSNTDVKTFRVSLDKMSKAISSHLNLLSVDGSNNIQVVTAASTGANENGVPTGSYTVGNHSSGATLFTSSDRTTLGNKADKVASATNGNFASLDSNGNLTDSGHKHSDYKTAQTAVNSPSADGTTDAFIDTISQNANGDISITKKTVADATTSAHGLMSATDKTKLDGMTPGTNIAQLVDGKVPSSQISGYVTIAQGVENEGKFLIVNSSGNVEAIALSVWEGGNY